jgi:DNA-binding transcriptional MerR regulator
MKKVAHLEAEKLMSADEVSSMLAIPKETLAFWRKIGKGPDFHRIGKYVRYHPSDVLAFLDRTRVVPSVRSV